MHQGRIDSSFNIWLNDCLFLFLPEYQACQSQNKPILFQRGSNKPVQAIPIYPPFPISSSKSNIFSLSFFFSYGTYRPSVCGRTHRDAGEAKQVPRKNKSCPKCYRSQTFYSALKEGEIVSQGERRNGDVKSIR